MDISNLLDDFLVLAATNSGTGTWRDDVEPVDLITFFVDKNFLGERPYPGKQTELLEAVNEILWYKFTDDPNQCPPSLQKVTEACVLLGKGSGKDFLASGIICYICYLLCSLRDPQGFFNFGKGENIDIINVAINAYQANNVFFKKLKARFASCGWFKKTSGHPKAYNEYQLTKNQVRLYQNITAHSAHSEADAYEGFNPLIILFDEIGGFDFENAEFCYTTLKSSAVTRYNEKRLLIFISFPRSYDDFMMKKYREAQEDETIYSITGKSWEVNPNISRASLQPDYDRDPETAATLYECRPPAYKEGFFRFHEKINDVVVVGKKSQCPALIVQEKVTCKTLANGEERFFIGLDVYNLTLDPSFIYYIGGDGGVETDSYVISLFHAEPMLVEVVEGGERIEKWVNKPVEDLLLKWEPSKKDRLPVDLQNVADILELICQQVFVKKALFDKFNSADVVQRLMNYGVEAEDKNFSNPFQLQIYSNFKSLIYTGQVELLDHQVDEGVNANDELKALKLINGNKIDHDKDGTKDMSDARASAVHVCSTDEPEEVVHYSMPVLKGAKRGSSNR